MPANLHTYMCNETYAACCLPGIHGLRTWTCSVSETYRLCSLTNSHCVKSSNTITEPINKALCKLSINIKLVYRFTTNSFTFFWRGGVSAASLSSSIPLRLPRCEYLDHSLWWLATSIATSGYGWCCRHQCGFLINEALWWQGFGCFAKGGSARKLLKTDSILQETLSCLRATVSDSIIFRMNCV